MPAEPQLEDAIEGGESGDATAAAVAVAAVAGRTAIDPDANGAVVIPDSWTSIGAFAFQECYGLTTVRIPLGGLDRQSRLPVLHRVSAADPHQSDRHPSR